MAAANWDALDGLLRTHNAETGRLRPATFARTGRGLAAMTSIPAGGVLVRLPASLIVTPHKARTALGPAAAGLSATQALVCFLLKERAAGRGSAWAPYIDSIPQDFSFMPAHSAYPAMLLEALPGDVRQAVAAQRGSIEADHTACLASAAISEALLEHGAFLWAWLAVNTRCITYNDKPGIPTDAREHLALAPFLDLLNHSDSADVSTRVDPFTGDFEIVANSPVAPGAEALIYYGPHDNANLLVEYGFIVRNNRFSSVPVGQVVMAALGDRFADRIDALVRAGFDVAALRCAASELDWSLLVALRVLALDHSAWRQQPGEWRRLLTGEVDRLDDATERRALTFLHRIAQEQRAALDKAALVGDANDARSECVAELRLERARIWAAIVEHCQRQLAHPAETELCTTTITSEQVPK